MKVGDVVAYCYSGNRISRRVRNMTVVRVTKTYIETDDGSKFSAKSFWLTQSSDGSMVVARSYYIDPEVWYWDRREAREKNLAEMNSLSSQHRREAREKTQDQMNSLFSQIAEFAGNRNWQKTKEAFSQLKSFMGE